MKAAWLRLPISAQGVTVVSLAVVIARADSWQLSALALAAAGAISLTRIRFSAEAAIALLVLVAALAITGHGPARGGG